MHSTPLLKRIEQDYPQFSFKEADAFRWSPETHTIHIDPSVPDAHQFTLHELGHALLNHQSYVQDVDLLQIERDAWQYAITHLTATYGITISEELIEDNLDTYREWLHARSLCPSCHMTGLQSIKGRYSCLACGSQWKSNEARNCALRRRLISTKNTPNI